MKKKILQVVQLLALWLLIAAVRPADVAATENVADASGRLADTPLIEAEDFRVKKLSSYLERHNSPLAKHTEDFIRAADRHNLGKDWSLVAAIAGVESTFGKFVPRNSYNAWGWGIPTGARAGIGFDNWVDGIDTVTQGLAENYIAKGADTPEKMGPIYAPPSTTWAWKVRFFMEEIENTPLTPEITI